MTYIGQQPSTTFDSGIQDRFTGLTTNTVTLTHDISAETDILVVWNNIVQDSSTYSVGGTGNKTLTLGGTLSSGDVVTVYYTNKVMQSVNPTAGSVGTNQLIDNSVGVTQLNVSDGSNGQALTTNGSGTLAFATVGGTNTPSFMVAKTSAQSISNNTAVKITWQTELVDSDNAFASEKFVVPSGKQGTYLIFATLEMDSKNNSDLKNCYVKLYKNGSMLQQHVYDFRSNQPRRMAIDLTGIHTLSASDYLEMYAQIDSDDGDIEVDGASSGDGYLSTFGGFKLL